MQYFNECLLHESGALFLMQGELVHGSAADVSLLVGEPSLRSRHRGTVYVTTHRIAWVRASDRDAAHIYLSGLARAPNPLQDASRRLRGMHRIQLGIGKATFIDFLSETGRADRERIQGLIAHALGKREWLKEAQKKVAVAPVPLPSSTLKTAGVARGGIGTVVHVAKEDARNRGEVISAGFGSLETLMNSANALVQIASRFRLQSADNQDDNELLNMIAEMGIESPVTKEATGNNTKLYRKDLAMQISDFLTKVVVRVGGIITISDAYCYYNRARATIELVSPEDFNAALRLLSSVNSHLELFTLSSGVRALRVDVTKEAGGAKALAALAEERSCLTALDIVQERGISLQVALSMLEAAERSGNLARDDTTDGVRFFPNRFPALLQSQSK
jgi:ESCRT-II complex subunit VPS36